MPDSLSQSANPKATFFPVRVAVRNPGSITDDDPGGAARLAGGKTTGTIMAATDWVDLLDANITATGTYAALPSFTPLTIAAGTKAAFWFRFTDGTKPMRSNPPKLGVAPYFDAASSNTYAVFNASADGSFSVSWAIQATDINTANWGNIYTFAGDISYTTCQSSTSAPPPPPAASPPPPSPPPPVM